jgi:hypothetical protein
VADRGCGGRQGAMRLDKVMTSGLLFVWVVAEYLPEARPI